MTIKKVIVTGATGKTGRRVSALLKAAGHQVYQLSRSGKNEGTQRHFDWNEQHSYNLGFNEADWQSVDSAYLLAPAGVVDLLPAMKPFIDRLLERDITPVLLSSSSLESGGPFMGAVHEYLQKNASLWHVLRPSWFMENFSEQQHLPTIRDKGKIFSATEDGKVGFVSADDIAAVAVRLLTDHNLKSGDYIITGPEAISYDTVAQIISESIGKQITHERLTVALLSEQHQNGGLSKEYADGLAALDAAIAAGDENRVTDCVERLSGKPPVSFESFAREKQAVWIS